MLLCYSKPVFDGLDDNVAVVAKAPFTDVPVAPPGRGDRHLLIVQSIADVIHPRTPVAIRRHTRDDVRDQQRGLVIRFRPPLPWRNLRRVLGAGRLQACRQLNFAGLRGPDSPAGSSSVLQTSSSNS